ncbi:MAG: 2-amino-4-hydroxy-6-hydroxymethyldihydropteridine diphosphokinase [Calditrichaeota bacterium]|nr:2-amino-4-hydroxy-6-hydroxymethyldihydropteridine diphosphokinase [Calditrichota bacterium]
MGWSSGCANLSRPSLGCATVSRWRLPVKPESSEGVHAFLSLGSNLGDRLRNLTLGMEAVAALPATRVVATSRFYETEPVGLQEQPPFLNAVMQIATSLSPHHLLRELQAIELRMGRQRLRRWGPRTLDIDIVLYGSVLFSDAMLTVPHPRFAERRFVLVPLAELAPTLIPPGTSGRTVIELLANCPDRSAVRLMHNARTSSRAIVRGRA